MCKSVKLKWKLSTIPDLGYAPEDSCHNDHPLCPRLYLFGPRCKHTDSCRSHSECLLSEKTFMFVFKNAFKDRPNMPTWFHLETSLTIAVNINSTGIPLSIVVCVCLVSVGFKDAVVTAVANIIPVCVILARVVHSWTVVLILWEYKSFITKMGHNWTKNMSF